jgi:phytoene dehydrogenase-like protein
MAEYDTVVIGAGHNGLVTAAYLARAGARVLVLERRPIVGGACVTEETWPGYRINTYAEAGGLLRPKIVADLDLVRYGYDPIVPDPQAFLPQADGRALTFWLDESRTQQELSKFSEADARAYPEYIAFWNRALDVIEPAMLAPPLPLDQFLASLPRGQAESLLRDLFLRSIRDFLDDWFESPELKGALAARATMGTFAGPYTPGTAFLLGYRGLGRIGEHRRVAGSCRGGMGRAPESIARSATAAGATIRTDIGVRELVIEHGRVVGVVTHDGEAIRSKTVASNLDVPTTLLQLAPPGTLDREVEHRIGRIRARGACLKLNAAMDGVPKFTAAPATEPSVLVGAVSIAPNMEYIERAFDDAKFGSFSRGPAIDIHFPSLVDPSLAPDGKHTMSCLAQYAPSRLIDGAWDDAREAMVNLLLSTIEAYAPNIRPLVRHWQVVTPLDLERTVGLTGGNVDQGDMTPDQMFSLRPIPGWSSYRTPVPGLYLCGSAAHPGGGVTGAPGHNAAAVILGDLHAPDTARA